ncbi:MAG: AAA family ATPase [Candidatus Omnitrophica bacterium]|nr:AAA family ATPase [Candidatus Omnitrophota bacterium]
MIRSFYGISENPFSSRNIQLLPHQEEIYDTLKVHCQQGGLSMVLGIPGTGKTVIKEFLKESCSKQQVVVTVARTLHTYTNTIKILCEAFNIDFEGTHFRCEKRLIEEAVNLNRLGKTLITIIDDAHLMEMTTLRRLRLMFEDFPKNHNIILIGQPSLLSNLALTVNQDIKTRVTYSAITRRLNPDAMQAFILSELDRIRLGHNTFSEAALELIIRSCDGVLRKTRNLCLSSMLEAVRNSQKTIDIDIVNRVLIQPHWRKECDITDF